MAMDFDADGAVHLRAAYDVGVIDRLRSEAEARIALKPSFDRPKLPVREIVIDGTPGDELLLTPEIRKIAARYFGRPGEPFEISNVRRMLPGARPLPYHQDETLLGRRVLNIWVPLSACGVDAPGLEIVRGSWGRLLETASIPDSPMIAEHNYLPLDQVHARFAPSAFYAPTFEVGDAMVFAGSTIHRTHMTPAMTRGRLSVELRLA